MLAQSVGILRQSYEYGLGDVLSGVRFVGHAKRSGVNEIDVSADQFAERGFRTMFGEVTEQLLVSAVVHSLDNTRLR